MAKKIDPKAKAKKQKIYAAVGGVLLVGVLAFQVPRTMKMLHPPNVNNAAPTTPASTTPTSGPIAAPSLSGGNATATAAAASGAGDGLADPDVLPLPESGQLLSFGRFRTKDPFAQQLRLACVGDATACSSASPTTGSAPAKTRPKAISTGVPSGKAPAAGSAVRTTAVILVNGDSQSVQVGGQFPTADPAFRLVALTATTAKIGVAGGSFASGSQTVTLKKNKSLTLMNTADGTRYVLRLVSVS